MDGVWPLISGSSSGACHAMPRDASLLQQAPLKRTLSSTPRVAGVRHGAMSLGAPTCRGAIAYDRVLFILPAGRRVRVTGPDLPVYTLKGLSGHRCTPAPSANECPLLGRCLALHLPPNFTLLISPRCLHPSSPRGLGKSSKPEAFPRRAPGITPALAGENSSPRVGRELHQQEWMKGRRRPWRARRGAERENTVRNNNS